MKFIIKLISMCVLGLVIYGHAMAGPLIIQLSENSTVVGPNITIGEIADLIGSGGGDLEHVRRLVVGKAAPANDVATITQQYIKICLRREGFTLSDFDFQGADASKVLTKSQEFHPSDLLPEIKKFVLKQIKEDSANVDVKLAGQDKKIILPAGDIKSDIRPTFSGKYEGQILLTAELEINDRLQKVLPLRVNIEIYHPVVVTTKRVEKGDKFTPENTALVRTPTSKILSGSLSQLNYVTGRTAARPLVPNSVLRIEDIFDPPAIVHGSMVQAIVRRGNVELIVDTRAVEDGKAGDMIRVENTSSHKVLRGKVLDEKTVLIEQEKP
jgi:flagella basal body P-ring formation protein FlgA